MAGILLLLAGVVTIGSVDAGHRYLVVHGVVSLLLAVLCLITARTRDSRDWPGADSDDLPLAPRHARWSNATDIVPQPGWWPLSFSRSRSGRGPSGIVLSNQCRRWRGRQGPTHLGREGSAHRIVVRGCGFGGREGDAGAGRCRGNR
jgi:hypothetical protein